MKQAFPERCWVNLTSASQDRHMCCRTSASTCWWMVDDLLPGFYHCASKVDTSRVLAFLLWNAWLIRRMSSSSWRGSRTMDLSDQSNTLLIHRRQQLSSLGLWWLRTCLGICSSHACNTPVVLLIWYMNWYTHLLIRAWFLQFWSPVDHRSTYIGFCCVADD